MKREDMIKQNFIDMTTEYEVSHHKICRKIDSIFVDEAKHFKNLLTTFNADYNSLSTSQINLVTEQLVEIFNNCKVILVRDYKSRFEKNVDLLASTMYDFFIRKLTNKNLKCPSKEMNKYLMEICKFNTFIFEDKLENSLIDFSSDFVYRYVNSEEARRDFMHLMKNVNYSLMCELKKAISNSIQDKQDIIARYNSLNKDVLSKQDLIR